MLLKVLATVLSAVLTILFLVKALTAGSTSGSFLYFLLTAASAFSTILTGLVAKKAYDAQQKAEAEERGGLYTAKPPVPSAPEPAPTPSFGRSSFDHDYAQTRTDPAAATGTPSLAPSGGYNRTAQVPPAPARSPYPDFAPNPPAPVYPQTQPMQPVPQQRNNDALVAGMAGVALGGAVGYGLGAATTGAHATTGNRSGETWAPRRDDSQFGSALGGDRPASNTLAPVTGDQLDSGQVGPGAAAAAAGAVGLGASSGLLDPVLGDDLDAKGDTNATAPVSGDKLDAQPSDPTAPISGDSIDDSPWSKTSAIDGDSLDHEPITNDIAETYSDGFSSGASLEPVSANDLDQEPYHAPEPEPVRETYRETYREPEPEPVRYQEPEREEPTFGGNDTTDYGSNDSSWD